MRPDSPRDYGAIQIIYLLTYLLITCSDCKLVLNFEIYIIQSQKASHLLTISIAGNTHFQICRYWCPADSSCRIVNDAKMTRYADSCRHRRCRRQPQHASYAILLS